jgi:hypothetical protein
MWVLLAVTLALCFVTPGCQICVNARRTIFREPSEFCWKADRKRSIKTYRAWADEAWCRALSSGADLCLSDHYAAGFKDGFVDYVYAGGNGEPPPVPPRRFWNVSERNVTGQNAGTEWFAGFRHGSQVARQEGYRDRATIKSSIGDLDLIESCLADACQQELPATSAPAESPDLEHDSYEEISPLLEKEIPDEERANGEELQLLEPSTPGPTENVPPKEVPSIPAPQQDLPPEESSPDLDDLFGVLQTEFTDRGDGTGNEIAKAHYLPPQVDSRKDPQLPRPFSDISQVEHVTRVETKVAPEQPLSSKDRFIQQLNVGSRSQGLGTPGN